MVAKGPASSRADESRKELEGCTVCPKVRPAAMKRLAAANNPAASKAPRSEQGKVCYNAIKN